MKKTAATTLVVLALLGGGLASAGAASAAPKSSKCPGENFQIVDGRCISDGRAEKIGDRGNR